jgi:hypothetical protein
VSVPTTPTKAKAGKAKAGPTPSTPSKRKRAEGKPTPKTPEKKRKVRKPASDEHDDENDDYNNGDNSGVGMSDTTLEGGTVEEGVFPSSEGEAEHHE